jgi:glucokinase
MVSRSSYVCDPSEGGHAEWAPRGAGSDDTQIELLKFLKIKFAGWARVSVERIVSGPGICNIYEYLAFRNPERVDSQVHGRFLNRTTEDAGIIARSSTPLAEEAVEIFLGCYGAEAGVMA